MPQDTQSLEDLQAELDGVVSGNPDLFGGGQEMSLSELRQASEMVFKNAADMGIEIEPIQFGTDAQASAGGRERAVKSIGTGMTSGIVGAPAAMADVKGDLDSWWTRFTDKHIVGPMFEAKYEAAIERGEMTQEEADADYARIQGQAASLEGGRSKTEPFGKGSKLREKADALEASILAKLELSEEAIAFSDPSFWNTEVPQGVGSMVPAIGATLAAGPAAGYATFAGQGSTNMYNEAAAAGGSPEQRIAAYLSGGAIGLTEAVPVGRLLGRLSKMGGKKKFAQGLAAVVAGAAEEGLQETGQTALEQLFAQQVIQYADKKSFGENLRESLHAGLVGLTIGGLMSGGGVAIQTASDSRDPRAAKKFLAGVEGDEATALFAEVDRLAGDGDYAASTNRLVREAYRRASSEQITTRLEMVARRERMAAELGDTSFEGQIRGEFEEAAAVLLEGGRERARQEKDGASTLESALSGTAEVLEAMTPEEAAEALKKQNNTPDATVRNLGEVAEGEVMSEGEQKLVDFLDLLRESRPKDNPVPNIAIVDAGKKVGHTGVTAGGSIAMDVNNVEAGLRGVLLHELQHISAPVGSPAFNATVELAKEHFPGLAQAKADRYLADYARQNDGLHPFESTPEGAERDAKVMDEAFAKGAEDFVGLVEELLKDPGFVSKLDNEGFLRTLKEWAVAIWNKIPGHAKAKLDPTKRQAIDQFIATELQEGASPEEITAFAEAIAQVMRSPSPAEFKKAANLQIAQTATTEKDQSIHDIERGVIDRKVEKHKDDAKAGVVKDKAKPDQRGSMANEKPEIAGLLGTGEEVATPKPSAAPKAPEPAPKETVAQRRRRIRKERKAGKPQQEAAKAKAAKDAKDQAAREAAPKKPTRPAQTRSKRGLTAMEAAMEAGDVDDFRFAVAPAWDTPEWEAMSAAASPAVKDENGKMRVGYHGTQGDTPFSVFEASGAATGAASAKRGVFGSTRPTVATGYAHNLPDPKAARLRSLSRKASASGRQDLSDRLYALYERREEETNIAPAPEEFAQHVFGREYWEDPDFREEDMAWLEEQLRTKVGARIMPVYFFLNNPLVVDYGGEAFREEAYSEAIDRAQSLGHDGVVFRRTLDSIPVSNFAGSNQQMYGQHPEVSDIFVAFEPNQVKSVWNRRPTSSPDIRFAVDGGEAAKTGVPLGSLKTPEVRKHLGKWLRSRGDLPQEAFKAMLKRDGAVAVANQHIAETMRMMRRAARTAYGGLDKMTPGQLKALDAALKNPSLISTLPKPMQRPISKMRVHISTLSQQLIDVGAVEGDLVATVLANMDVYATRSYQAFDDPKWAEKVSEAVRNRAKAWMRKEFPTLSADEIDGKIKGLLYEASRTQSPMALLASGKLGSKDLSILISRKRISPAIRALLGEYEDPMVNYARSVSHMTFLIANHQFLGKVKEAGLVDGGFLSPPDHPTSENHAKIAADASHVMAPLNGLHTSPEVLEAFEYATTREGSPQWLQMYMKVNGMGKMMKTVGSVQTHARNTFGNAGFALANGHWRVMGAVKAGQGTAASLGWSSQKEYLEYYREALHYGVTHESATAGELYDVLEDAMGKSPNDILMMQAGRNRLLKAGTLATSAYQAEDDVWKLYAWENEKARYRAAHPEWSDAQVKERAAEIVRATYPTYSLVPRLTKAFRKAPWMGSFVSFPSEVIRTSWNLAHLIKAERSDPKTRKIGNERLAGALMAVGSTAALSAATAFLFGYDGDDEEAILELEAPWTKNSDLLFLPRGEDGRARYIDLSYTDPFSYLKAPLNALLRGDSIADGVFDALSEAADPFFGEEMLMKAVREAKSNKTATGGTVYNEAAPAWQQGGDIASYIWRKALEPGTLSSARRIKKGVTDHVEPWGKTYDTADEVFAVMLGQRRATMDAAQALSFRAPAYKRKLSNATRMLTSVASRAGRVSDDEIRDAYEGMEAVRRKAFDEIVRAIAAARTLGESEGTVRGSLEGSGMSKSAIRDAMDGVYEPYEPGSSFLKSYERDAASDRVKQLRDRRKLVKSIARESN